MDKKYLESVLCNITAMDEPPESALQTAGAIVALLGAAPVEQQEIKPVSQKELAGTSAYLHGGFGSEIRGEFESAEKYFKKYKESGDENYKRMAWDEISHAEFLIKRARLEAQNKSEIEELRILQAEHDRLSHLLNI